MGLALTSSLPLRPREWDDPHGWTERVIFGCSYSTFSALREDVARFYGVTPYRRLLTARRAVLPPGGDAFWYHSDCDGEWTTEQCQAIARLLQPYAMAGDSRLHMLADQLHTAAAFLGAVGGHITFA